MKEKLNFEEIANDFSKEINRKNPRMSSISRCDWLIIKENKILFIEETSFENKNLLSSTKYSKEIIENIKKMWGSFAIFTWYYSTQNNFDEIAGKDRIFLIYLNKSIDGRFIRMLGNIMKSLKKYKNSAFSEVKYKIKDKR